MHSKPQTNKSTKNEMVDERSQWLTEAGGVVRLAVTSELQSKAQSTLNKPFKLSDNTRHFLVNCFSELKDMLVFRIESLHIFHRITVMYCFVLKWPWNPIKHYQPVLPQFPCLPEIGFFWIVFGTFFFWGNREYLFLRVLPLGCGNQKPGSCNKKEIGNQRRREQSR